MMYRLLADFLVLFHFAYVAFVAFGLPVILIGGWLGWSWVRNFWFRVVHLAAILIVAGQALLGIICPLTVWESQLRRAGGGEAIPGTFMGRLVHSMLFFDLPHWAFTLGYCIFGILVVAAWILVPPRWPPRRGSE